MAVIGNATVPHRTLRVVALDCLHGMVEEEEVGRGSRTGPCRAQMDMERDEEAERG